MNEPDGIPTGGSQPSLPEAYAQLWPTIVDNARAKGYTEFAGPQMESSDQKDSDKGLAWQVRFLTALDQVLDGKDDKASYLTYVSYHVYEPHCHNPANDIATYYKGQMDKWTALAPWWTA